MHRERVGEIAIFSEAFLWGLFPVITVISFTALPPFVSLAISTFFSVLFFGTVLSVRKTWNDITNTAAFADTLWATLILGIVFYMLYYTALLHTSPGNASLIALTEIFFSYALFHVFRKEHFPGVHILGSALMLIGAAIVLYPNTTEFHIGDLIILAAAAIAPFGNFFQRRARTVVSSESILFSRSVISTLAIFVFSYLFGEHPFSFIFSLSPFTLALLAVNGFFLFGLTKILWVEGIHRISITKANALQSIGPLLTLFFAYLFLKTPPTSFQLLAFVPMFFGVLLLGRKSPDA